MITKLFLFSIIGAIFILSIISIYFFTNNDTFQLESPISSEKISNNTQESILAKTQYIQTDNPTANKILVKCGNEKNCAIEELQKLTKTESRQTILTTVDDLLSRYQEEEFFCHESAHHLGKFLYGYLGVLSEALSFVDRRCGGALYHGVLESYLNSEVLIKGVALKDIEISGICTELEDFSYGLLIECPHGLGHGLMKTYGNDLSAAMKHCDQLEHKIAQINCYEGASMGNVREIINTKSGDFDENDILYPCNKLDTKYAIACYHYHALYILKQNDYSSSESFKVCDNLELEELVKSCYEGIGGSLTVFFTDNMKNMAVECKKGHPDYQKDCIRNAAVVMIDQKSIDETLEFCRSMPNEFKMDCYDVLGQGIKSYYPKDLEAACSKVEENYYDVCVKGIPLKSDCTITYESGGKTITYEQECILN